MILSNTPVARLAKRVFKRATFLVIVTLLYTARLQVGTFKVQTPPGLTKGIRQVVASFRFTVFGYISVYYPLRELSSPRVFFLMGSNIQAEMSHMLSNFQHWKIFLKLS